jgi:hypothetical protein
MIADVDVLYRQHLSDSDRAVLEEVAPGSALVEALGTESVEAAVFGTHQWVQRPAVAVTPFLTFAVAVHRTAWHIGHSTHIDEWAGPRVRLPVFDVDRLSPFLADPVRRFFMIELLASYTHVSSGVSWEHTARGWRQRRFNELDPLTLADQLESVDAEQRPGVYRRLGDLALFLTGVFPDNTAREMPAGARAARLLRLSGLSPAAVESLEPLAFYECLGARWYQQAGRCLAGVPTASVAVAADYGEHFNDARRILNSVTDRYLFPLRQQWFGP